MCQTDNVRYCGVSWYNTGEFLFYFSFHVELNLLFFKGQAMCEPRKDDDQRRDKGFIGTSRENRCDQMSEIEAKSDDMSNILVQKTIISNCNRYEFPYIKSIQQSIEYWISLADEIYCYWPGRAYYSKLFDLRWKMALQAKAPMGS